MNAPWRLFAAALHFFTRGSVPPGAATSLVPLAGILLGSVGAGVYWLGAQLWPTSIAVVLAMLATVALAMPDAPAPTGGLLRVFFVLIKYNALMALSSARAPIALPEHVTLGLIMVAGQAASRALAVSAMASKLPAALRTTTPDLTVALILGLAPAALLGIPGLMGLAAAIAMRLAQSANLLREAALPIAERLDLGQQLTEISFYLGALAAWRYV
ncbi:MAG: hypothetical protein ABSH33_05775 [Steroidobacteraceae bacterium]|jgi:cobalamin synthase